MPEEKDAGVTSKGPSDVPSGQNPPAPPPGTPVAESPLTALTSSDWEALTKLMDAKKELAVAKRPFFDRVVMSGLLPIALLIVGPWATYYFANRAEEGIEEVKKANAESVKLSKLVADLETTLKGAEEKISAMDNARASELAKMESMVHALDDTLKNALIQMTVARIISERTSRDFTRKPADVGTAPSQPMPWLQPAPVPVDPDAESTINQGDEITREAVEQLQMPGFDGEELRGKVKNAYQRINARK